MLDIRCSAIRVAANASTPANAARTSSTARVVPKADLRRGAAAFKLIAVPVS